MYVCVIQLDGVHLGFILGMVVNVTDSTTLLSQTESLSLALLLPLAILLILLFVAFLLMSFVFLCYAGGRRRHVYKVFFLFLISSSSLLLARDVWDGCAL